MLTSFQRGGCKADDEVQTTRELNLDVTATYLQAQRCMYEPWLHRACQGRVCSTAHVDGMRLAEGLTYGNDFVLTAVLPRGGGNSAVDSNYGEFS